MKRYYFLFVLFIFTSIFSAHSTNDTVHIEVSAPQLSDRKIFLGSYFNGLVYRQDSIVLSSQGKGVFHKNENYPEGQYLLSLQNDLHVDFLLADDQSFSIFIDTTDLILKTKITGAGQTEALLTYSQFLNGEQKKRQKIVEEFKALPEDQRDMPAAKAQLAILNEEVEKYQTNLHIQFKEKWVSLFLRSVDPVTTGPYPFPKTQEEFNAEFNYQKYHYFDNINLQDPRFWRTLYFPQKIITYLEKQVEQYPDSLANAASRLVAETKGDSLCFQWMLNKLFNYSTNSQIMGMENIRMKLVEDYHHKGLVNWGDSTFWDNIEFDYIKARYNRIGMIAHDLELQDADGKSHQLYDLGKKYTLLYFFEPDCGHCIKTTPEIYEKIYKKYADKGLDVVAVDIYNNKEQWLDFVKKNHLEGEHWHNLWDPDHRSEYYRYYDTVSTPGIYILDENKKIIAKKIDVETLDRVFNNLLIEKK
jgi:thiol-disulfide isomerase/thioredoxin